MRNLYSVLGVSEKASAGEIRAAFRALAMRYHPDHCHEPDATERFVDIRQAFELLSSPEKRALHDKLLAMSRVSAEVTPKAAPEGREYERWSAHAREEAEREAQMTYADFLKALLRSTGEGVAAVTAGAAEGAFQGLRSSFLKLLFMAVVGVPIVLFVAGYIAWSDHKFAQATADLRPHLDDYLKQYADGALRTQRPAPGRMVVVDVQERDFHSAFKKLLLSSRLSMGATKDSDVDQILQVDCSRQSVGKYSDKSDAWRWFCTYALVDYREKRVVFRESISGSPPPAQKRGKYDGSGENPIFGVVSTLEAEFLAAAGASAR